MRVNPFTRYPHPVLAEDTDDYTDGHFDVEMRVSESKTTGRVTIDYAVSLDEAHLGALVDQGQAAIGLFVVSGRTYYNKLHPLDLIPSQLEFATGELRDLVVLRPVVCAIDHIYDFVAANLHEEFGNEAWSFKPGDVLALGAEVRVDIGLEKLAPMETIFNLETQDEIPDGETKVMLELDKIAIRANKKTCDGIHTLRNSGVGRLALLNGVYLPAVMETLSALSEDPGAFDSRRWFRVFAAKCEHLGINMEKPNLLEDAQKLLRSPLGQMLNSNGFKPQ